MSIHIQVSYKSFIFYLLENNNCMRVKYSFKFIHVYLIVKTGMKKHKNSKIIGNSAYNIKTVLN